MAGCRRGDPKWAAIIVKNSSATQPPQNLEVRGADTSHITQTLLIRAGDVESNPGPKRKQKSHSKKEDDFDDILVDLARLIPNNKNIDTLGKALGFDPAEIERYIATNTRYQNVTYDGTLKMLRDWRNNKRKATERPALVHALREAKLERFADTLLMNSKVPDLQTTFDNLPQPDLLESVVKDIKKYYKLNMCTIQADPTNNDEMFEFNHIYTDPTLSEEDRNDKTIRNPLLYCNLLKTKINGQLPNRLLVQGGGGAGKTTFCSKIAWDWANDLGFQQFKLVAVIPFRKAKNKTVGEVIKSYLSDNNPFTAAQIDNYIMSNPKYVFLVFDGLYELRGKFSDQIGQIILNKKFMSGTVLVTSRQWSVHEIRSITELKKVYAFLYIDGFSVDNVDAYITKFFLLKPDAANSSQELIDFIYSNDVIADNMAPYPIFIAMLCIMWRQYDGERREAMSKLMTFSQLFDEMVYFLVDHCGSKDDSQTGLTVQELRQMIPNHLKAIGEIAIQGIVNRRPVFLEDTFESCRESMEMGCKVGVLTREEHATPRRDRRKNPRLQISTVQFPHKLFQEYMAAQYLASLYSSDRFKYNRIMATILKRKEELRYLLYFTSAQEGEIGLEIVSRLLAQEPKRPFFVDAAYEGHHQTVHMTNRKFLKQLYRFSALEASGLMFIGNQLGEVKIVFSAVLRKMGKCYQRYLNSAEGFDLDRILCLIGQELRDHFIIDVAYESQHKSVAVEVGNHFMRSSKTLEITASMSKHTSYGSVFIKNHLGGLVIKLILLLMTQPQIYFSW